MSTRRQFLQKFMIGGGIGLTMLQNDALAIVADAVKGIGPGEAPDDLADKEWFWSRIQTAFELDRSLIHLNSGGVSASPRTVHNALKRQDVKFQTVDLDPVFYHRYHAHRILDGMDVITTQSGYVLPEDPWQSVHYKDWNMPEFL